MPTKTKRRAARNRTPSASRVVAARPSRVAAVKAKVRSIPKLKINGNGSAHRVRSTRATASAINEKDTFQELLLTQPNSMDDYLLRIRALGDRIRGYVQFMASVENMNGSCLEAKRRSMSLFYERLVLMDRELNRIQEELQLA